MAQYERRHQRKRRHIRFARLYGFLTVLLVLAAVIGGCIVFFRVDQVTVEGNSRYTDAEIVAVSEIESGDNMFLLNKYQIIDRLLSELAYVDQVSIRRSLPSTIRITVSECAVAAAVENGTNGEWWLINTAGKLLERTDEPGSRLEVTGLTLAAPSVGTRLAVTEEQRLQGEALVGLLTALDARGMLGSAQSIDLSASSSLTMLYDNRLTVKLKLSADFSYETRVLAEVLENYVEEEWAPSDTGTLDRTQDDGLTHLIRNEPEN